MRLQNGMDSLASLSVFYAPMIIIGIGETSQPQDVCSSCNMKAGLY